jgi:two-component sensor histidine kinase
MAPDHRGGRVASLLSHASGGTETVTSTSIDTENVERLVETAGLAEALESERFKRFLDHVPIAIAVSELRDPEVIIYVNPEFERVSGLPVSDLERRHWSILSGEAIDEPAGAPLVSAIVDRSDCVGLFRMQGSDGPVTVELHSNVIEDDAGNPTYRLVALVNAFPSELEPQSLVARIREKDTQLRELQHRVKNNLQMITALIRLETRNAEDGDQHGYERLAGRVASLALLYDALSPAEHDAEVDLGVYLGQIATAVMASHAVEGIRLDLRVDAYPVSINTAMPTGLVVNELLTNSLKHAFRGRDGGTITLHSIVDGDGCTVMVADDGVGLPEGETWPKRGRLGALIAESLRRNANAHFEVTSEPGTGTTVTITFDPSSDSEHEG